MKAISIRQPWAWLIVEGFKDIENRNWYTQFRGDIQIHAAKGCTQAEYAEACAFALQINRKLNIPALADLPRGGIVGIARVDDCVKASRSKWFVGKYGMVLSHPYPLPFRPLAGMLGIFNVNAAGEPEEILEALK